jgi:hypothetical protein
MAITVTLMTVNEYLAAHGEFGPLSADNVGRRARQISNAADLTLRRQGDDVLMTETALRMAAEAEWQVGLRQVGKHCGTLAKPFKGITKFARHYGYSRQHALDVLKGIRTSAPVLKDWSDWQKKCAAQAAGR